MPWTRRHLITIEELSLAEIGQIHSTAAAFKKILQRSVKKVPALRGKTIVNLFLEPSTRTRLAFDMAAKRLSACTSSPSTPPPRAPPRAKPSAIPPKTSRPSRPT